MIINSTKMIIAWNVEIITFASNFFNLFIDNTLSTKSR